MSIIDLPSREKPVTPKRPTLATPVLASQAAEKCVASLDEDLDFLFCIAATLAGTEGVPDQAIDGLNTLHARMKRNVDALYNLG